MAISQNLAGVAPLITIESGYNYVKAGYAVSLSDTFLAFKMSRSTETTQTSGVSRSPVKTEHYVSWEGCDLVSTQEIISGGIEWTIHDPRHVVIVHLGGKMTELETEMDGYGMSFSPASTGEIWIVPAGSHYASRANGDEIEYGVFFLDPSVVGNLIFDDVNFGEIAPLHGVRDDFCYYSAQKLIDVAQQDDDVSRLLGESVWRSLYLHLFQTYGQGSEPDSDISRRSLDKRTIEILRAYIYEHVGEKLTLATLLKLTGMRTNTFLVAFRRAFGQSPAQYIIAQRLRRAQWLLANSDDDITNISFEAGFSSHSHLSTSFKKHTGQTPSDFRLRWRGKPINSS